MLGGYFLKDILCLSRISESTSSLVSFAHIGILLQGELMRGHEMPPGSRVAWGREFSNPLGKNVSFFFFFFKALYIWECIYLTALNAGLNYYDNFTFSAIKICKLLILLFKNIYIYFHQLLSHSSWLSLIYENEVDEWCDDFFRAFPQKSERCSWDVFLGMSSWTCRWLIF